MATSAYHPPNQRGQILMLTIGIVAGEISGDSLGADFMQKMQAICPNVRFVGVGGDKMQALGLMPIIDMARLSVMGLSEVITHLPDLLKAKKQILTHFDKYPIDIFIGIDAPDFNLRLGKILKKQGIFCVQYVSPSIWAWRENRIHTIKKSTHLILCLFPFELQVYKKYNHPAVCVGHPLINSLYDIGKIIKTDISLIKKEQLFLNNISQQKIDFCHKPIIGLLAGSRQGEIEKILPILLQSFCLLKQTYPKATALIPLAKTSQLPMVKDIINASDINNNAIYILANDNTDNTNKKSPNQLSVSQSVIAVSDVSILASGTVTFEAQLLNSPMVVTYKVSALTYKIAKKLLKIPYVALPNILNRYINQKPAIVSELLQDNANPIQINNEIQSLLKNPNTSALSQLNDTIYQLSHNNPASTVLNYYQNNSKEPNNE